MLAPAFEVGWLQIFNWQSNLINACLCLYIRRDYCQAEVLGYFLFSCDYPFTPSKKMQPKQTRTITKTTSNNKKHQASPTKPTKTPQNLQYEKQSGMIQASGVTYNWSEVASITHQSSMITQHVSQTCSWLVKHGPFCPTAKGNLKWMRDFP